MNDYAAYTAFFAILIIIPGLIGNGINVGLVIFSAEHISKTGERPSEVYIISLIFQIILYSSFCIVLLVIADRVTPLLFGQKAFGSSLRYGLIGGLGLLLTEFGRSIYQAEERFGHYIRTLWFRHILAFVIVFLLFLAKQLNFQSAAKSMIAVELCVGFIITFYIVKDFSFKQMGIILSKQLDIVKDFLFSTGWLIGFFVTLILFQRLDIFMLSHFSTEEELANYGVAFRYYTMALLLLGSIHVVLRPRFTKADVQNLARQRQFLFKWLKTTVWLIIPITVADLFGKPLFVWISGAQYQKAFCIFVIFSIGVWLSLMFSPPLNILMARKAFKFIFALGIGALMINFAGNYLLIPLWGGLGAATITIISHGFINIASATRIFFSAK